MKRALAAILLAALFHGTSAFAQDAAEWKRRGDDAMDAGRAAEALDAYRHAQAIAPSPALDYNIGRALLAVGDFVAALDAFEKFDREAPPDLRQRTHRLDAIMEEIRAKIAKVTLTGVPPGARMFVRGASVSEATTRVNPGTVDVRVELDDHEPFTKTIELQPGATQSVAVELRRLPNVGTLTIIVRPFGASVMVDGIARGASPATLDLPAGRHEVQASAKDHEPKSASVDLVRGQAQRVVLELEGEKKPLTSRWWFWGAIGVVAAGATIGIIAGTSEHSPTDGSLGTFRVP